MNTVLLKYDEQLEKELQFKGLFKTDKTEKLCVNYWRKMLFLKSVHLNISDWAKIRSGDYYFKLGNCYNEIERIKFKINRINEYTN